MKITLIEEDLIKLERWVKRGSVGDNKGYGREWY